MAYVPGVIDESGNPVKPPQTVLTQEQAAALYQESTKDVKAPAPFYYDPSGKTPDSNNRKAQQAREQQAAQQNISAKDQHINALLNQYARGNANEKIWAKQALEKHGIKITSPVITEDKARAIYLSAGGDPAKFQFDPAGNIPTVKQKELSRYEVDRNVLTESQAKALYEASGGDPDKFEYKPPKVYNTYQLAYDIERGQSKLSKHDYEKRFGKGSYDEAVRVTTNMVPVNDSKEWVDKTWFNSLPGHEQKTVESGGIDAWNKTYLRQDPVTKQMYYIDDIKPLYGSDDGSINWNQLHQNQIATDVWAKIIDGKSVTSKDYRQYEQITGNTEGSKYAKAIVNDFKSLPQTDQIYIRDHGLANWSAMINDKQVRYDLADRALRFYKTDDGQVDILKFVLEVRDSGMDTKLAQSLLLDYGIPRETIKQTFDIARDIPKSQSDPDTFIEHFRNQSNKVSRYVAEKSELGGEYLWETIKHLNPGHYIVGTPEKVDKIGRGVSKGWTTIVAMPAQLTASYLDVGSGYAAGESRSATKRLSEMAPITYYEDKWTGFGPEMVKESKRDPWEAIPKNVIMVAPAAYGAGGLAVKGIKTTASKTGYPSVRAMAQNERGSMRMEWNERIKPQYESTGTTADYIAHVRDTQGLHAATRLQEAIQKHGNPKYMRDLSPEAIPQRVVESATRKPLPYKEYDLKTANAFNEIMSQARAQQLNELLKQSAAKHAHDLAMAEKTTSSISYETAVALSLQAMTAKQIAQEIAIDSDLAFVYGKLAPYKTSQALKILASVQMKPATDTKTKTAVATKTMTKTKTKTAVAVDTKLATAIRTAVKTQVATKTAVKTKTKTKTAVATKPAVKTKTKTAVATKTAIKTALDEPKTTALGESVGLLPVPGPGEPVGKKEPIIGPPRTLPIPPNKSKKAATLPDEETKADKKTTKRGKPGIVAWQQGEVDTKEGRKRVYVVASHDGSTIDRGRGGVEVRVGNPPSGMRRTKGTPQETLSILGGDPSPKLRVKVGSFRADITNGRIIDFRSAKRQGKIVRGKQPRVIRRRRIER